MKGEIVPIDEELLDLALHGFQVLHTVSVYDMVDEDDLSPEDQLQLLFLAGRRPLQGRQMVMIGTKLLMEMLVAGQAGLAKGTDMRSKLQDEESEVSHGYEGSEGNPEGFRTEVQGFQAVSMWVGLL